MEIETQENKKQKLLDDEKYRIEELRVFEEARRVGSEREKEEERMLIELDRVREEEKLEILLNLEAEERLQVPDLKIFFYIVMLLLVLVSR